MTTVNTSSMTPLRKEGTHLCFHTISYFGRDSFVYEIPALGIVGRGATPALAQQVAEGIAQTKNVESYESRLAKLETSKSTNGSAGPSARSEPAKG